MKMIIPAILTDNVKDLKLELDRIQGLSDWAQIDIMDGKFVNNISVSLEDIADNNMLKSFSLEAHLMVENPGLYFEQCEKSSIKRVIFQIEGTDDVERDLAEAGRLNLQKGLALKPETSLREVEPYINDLDVILLMSVEPGFQGQKFIEATLEKIKALRKMAPDITIEVDGGINSDNIKSVSDAGADYFVVGSELLKSKNIKETFEKLNSKIKK